MYDVRHAFSRKTPYLKIPGSIQRDAKTLSAMMDKKAYESMHTGHSGLMHCKYCETQCCHHGVLCVYNREAPD